MPSFLQEDPRLQQALNALTRDSLASVVLGSPPLRGEKAGYVAGYPGFAKAVARMVTAGKQPI